jgi:dTDP-D-glucose 4,6-dehydratase
MDIAQRLHRIICDDNFENHIEYVEDRLFNDFRYSVDTRKLNDLGWKPSIPFDQGLRDTVEWYRMRQQDYFVGNEKTK